MNKHLLSLKLGVLCLSIANEVFIYLLLNRENLITNASLSALYSHSVRNTVQLLTDGFFSVVCYVFVETIDYSLRHYSPSKRLVVSSGQRIRRLSHTQTQNGRLLTTAY